MRNLWQHAHEIREVHKSVSRMDITSFLLEHLMKTICDAFDFCPTALSRVLACSCVYIYIYIYMSILFHLRKVNDDCAQQSCHSYCVQRFRQNSSRVLHYMRSYLNSLNDYAKANQAERCHSDSARKPHDRYRIVCGLCCLLDGKKNRRYGLRYVP